MQITQYMHGNDLKRLTIAEVNEYSFSTQPSHTYQTQPAFLPLQIHICICLSILSIFITRKVYTTMNRLYLLHSQSDVRAAVCKSRALPQRTLSKLAEIYSS